MTCRGLERRWRPSRLPSSYQSYTDQRNVAKHAIFKSKMDYYSSLLYSAESDSKALFRTITRVLHRKADKRFPTSSSAVDLANKFIHFFEEKIVNIKSNLGTPVIPDEMHFHFYADDTQLYISFSTNNDMELTNSITKIEECLSDIDKWMSINRLKLNKDKTELLYLFSKYNSQQSLLPLRFGTDVIKPSSHARNIYWLYHYVNSSPSQQCL